MPNAGGSTWTDSFDISVGTSFAAPIVAGAAALVLSQRPALTPAEVRAVLRSSARAFPQTGADNGPDDPTPVAICRPPSGAEQLQCYCPNDGSLCGAGMLDADAAVATAGGASFARIALDTASPTAGQPVQLSARDSLPPLGGSLVAQSWVLVNGGGIVSGLDGAANAPLASFTPSAPGSVTVRLTVTDNAGGSASVEQVVSVAAAPTPTPTPTPPVNGDSGGGALGGGWLLALAAAAAWLRRR